MLVSLALIGYSVTRYQSLVEQRTTSKDYPISLLTITGLLGIYILVTLKLGLSTTEIMFVSILVILTHASVNLSKARHSPSAPRRSVFMWGCAVFQTIPIADFPILRVTCHNA